ncbi:2-oxoglutarate synthase [Ignisphaera aggregans DSM 17230]|uniref:2-oxoacid oxidoreductase (ferredoxin) n=1 Tax=Ignisphaera aggregans (strain DSM 17230 / JCM 13409 / AQ1.S1) TaxID=583356 RepID=E0SQ09_IGNAA|nr:2-oxoglutarate synthase [Ignisphaera aggregans DSM 17230]
MSILYRDVYIVIGGPQGAGLETSMNIIGYSFARMGYGVIADREYFSNIKGRHSYIHIGISSYRIPRSLDYPVKILASMDAETVFTHYSDVDVGGFIVYDTSVEDKTFDQIPSIEKELRERISREFKDLGIDGSLKDLIKKLSENRGVVSIGFRYMDILNEVSKMYRIVPQQLSRYLSSIVIGSVCGLLNIDIGVIVEAFNRRFKGRKDIVDANVAIVNSVMSRVRSVTEGIRLERPSIGVGETMIVSGNDAIAMGKIVAGVGYQAYYPITPAADESLFIEQFENLEVDGKALGSIAVIQTEDEISAINSAIGAALAGVRASTSTSGPGFSLMVEGLSWAGMNEVPVVITYYQRGGPSTGMPTRGSQSDLLFSLFAGHGEFPRVVIASGDHEEAFYDAINAFNIAEKYQVPVIHLVDKFLANSLKTVPLPDLDNIRIERGSIVTESSVDYRRFDKSSPISPRAFIGSKVIMWYAGDEHDEYGHIDEDPINRIEMYTKRMRKMEIIDSDIPEEERFIYYGDDNPDIALIGWGFVKGVALDAIETLSSRGIKASYIHIRFMSPFPKKRLRELLMSIGIEKIIAVEHSYNVQIADLIAMNIGIIIKKRIAKFSGRPMYRFELVKAIEDIMSGKTQRVVLSYGA